jgi:hypothetical protein
MKCWRCYGSGEIGDPLGRPGPDGRPVDWVGCPICRGSGDSAAPVSEAAFQRAEDERAAAKARAARA